VRGLREIPGNHRRIPQDPADHTPGGELVGAMMTRSLSPCTRTISNGGRPRRRSSSPGHSLRLGIRTPDGFKPRWLRNWPMSSMVSRRLPDRGRVSSFCHSGGARNPGCAGSPGHPKPPGGPRARLPAASSTLGSLKLPLLAPRQSPVFLVDRAAVEPSAGPPACGFVSRESRRLAPLPRVRIRESASWRSAPPRDVASAMPPSRGSIACDQVVPVADHFDRNSQVHDRANSPAVPLHGPGPDLRIAGRRTPGPPERSPRSGSRG